MIASADTVVLDDDLNPLEPGTGVVGRLAPRRQHPARLLQRSREDRGDVRHRHARTALVDPGRLRGARGRRSHHAARSRLGVDQLRRREDLSRRGRGRAEVAPRRVRRAGGRRARRAMGSTRRRALADRAATSNRHSRRSRRTAAARSRATRCRASCSSWPKSRGCPTASPTTGARRTKRPISPRPTDRRAEAPVVLTMAFGPPR